MQATLQVVGCESQITLNLERANLRDRYMLWHSDAFVMLYLDSRMPPNMTALTGTPAPSLTIPDGPRGSR
jgi:hypothetical protein